MKKKRGDTLKRYAYIDSLRGIAILLVLLAHTSMSSSITYSSWLSNVSEISLGPRGVQLFFVVSAFTLCLSLSKRKLKEKHAVLNFYIRRFFRIAPLFYLAIMYYLWQQNYWSGNPYHFSITNILSTLTFTNGLSPLWINNIVFGGWSIAVEMTFYLFFPLLFSIIKNFKVSLITTIIAMIVMQLVRLSLLSLPFIHNNPDLQTYTYQFFPSQLPVFLIGMTIFFMIQENIFANYRNYVVGIAVSVFCLLFVQVVFPFKIIAGHYIYGLLFGVGLFILSKYPTKFLVNPLIQYTGKISFSLYLCHWAVVYWLKFLGLDYFLPTDSYIHFVMRFVIIYGCATLIASILYFTVENSGVLLGKKIISQYET